MIWNVLTSAFILALLAGNVSAADKFEYQRLEDKIKKLETQNYAANVANAAAIEMLCRETHPADYCTELFKKATKKAQDSANEYIKEIAASTTVDSKPAQPKVVITNKWKDISLWRHNLKKGMSHDQVRSVFGEPDKINSYTTIGDEWHYGYPSGGTISFNANGLVNSWSEPHLK